MPNERRAAQLDRDSFQPLWFYGAMEKDTTTTAWNIESEYPSITAKEFEAEKQFVETNIDKIAKFGESIASLNINSPETVDLFAKMMVFREDCEVRTHNLSVYVSCLSTIDVTRNDVTAMDSKISDLASRLSQSTKAMDNFLTLAEESFIQKLLAKPELKPFEFSLKYRRMQRPYILSQAEESLLEAFSVSGHQAWATLYDSLIGSMKCNLTINGEEKTVGLSEAYAQMYGSSEKDRKIAWHAIQLAWKSQQESAAGIVNALAGWRIELSKKRSHQKPMNFLTQALFDNRIEEATLNALIECCRQNNDKILRSAKVMAKIAGKTQLDPWDLTASYPKESKGGVRTYREGMTLVQEAFANLNPEMAEFAKTMDKNAWIDSRVMETKSTGGYCTEFPKSRTPRIFMTYKGSMNHISTLAHELGHGYHSWVMRDIPNVESSYPSTLAETASVFAEQALRDHVETNSTDLDAKLEAGWSEMEAILAYLVDIPSRFEFEKTFHEKRQEQTLSAKELCALMDQVRSSWYKDTVSASDTLFWASKLHFSIAGSGFYNFAYAFGYLFAMSLYARRKERGPSFNKTYVEILRDTGRMTAEDLIQKHLGEDIRKTEFWQKSIDMVIEKITSFEKTVK